MLQQPAREKLPPEEKIIGVRRGGQKKVNSEAGNISDIRETLSYIFN